MSILTPHKNYGCCMMDYTTLVSAINYLNNPVPNPYAGGDYEDFERRIQRHGMQSLINLVEALVLQEKIFIPFLSAGNKLEEHKLEFGIGETYQKKIIEELRINRKTSNILLSAYAEYAKSEDFAHMFINSMQNISKLKNYNEIFLITESSSGTPYLKLTDYPDGYLSEEFRVLKNLIEAKKDVVPSRLFDQNWIEGPFYKPIARFIIRGLSYNEIAKIESIPYIPHPLRIILSMSEGLWSCNKTKSWGEIAVDFMREFRKDYASRLGGNIFELDIPFVFSNIIRECRNNQDIIPVTLEMRESKSAKAFREWNINITEALYHNSGQKVLQAMNELESLKHSLEKELGLASDKFTASIWILSYEIKIPRFLFALSPYIVGKRHVQFLHDYATRNVNIISLENEIKRVVLPHKTYKKKSS